MGRGRAARSLLFAPLLAGLGVVPGAQAAGPYSELVASPTAVSVVVGATSGAITVGLDGSTCPNALNNGQTYVIHAGTSSLVSVSPSMSGALHCGDSATCTVTGGSEGTGTLAFTPQANPLGQSKKLGATSIDVTVTCPTGTG